MKASDLMIGDWVSNEGSFYRIRQLGIFTEDRDGNDFPSVCIGKNNSIGLIVGRDEIEPIPLTPEILEKNNNLVQGDLPILFDDGKMHYSVIECKYVSKEYEQNGETFYCVLSSCAYPGGSFVTPFAKIQYVHELQHMLKLCGIEKEIKI